MIGFVQPNAELTGRRREDAKPGPQTMYRVPAAWAWWPAVGAPVERPVRPHTVFSGLARANHLHYGCPSRHRHRRHVRPFAAESGYVRV